MTTFKELNLCVNHPQEWKHSHYAEHNCDYCKILEENQRLRRAISEVARIDSTFKDPQTGLWLVSFTDFYGNEQQSLDVSLTKAVQRAMIMRTTCINQ